MYVICTLPKKREKKEEEGTCLSVLDEIRCNAWNFGKMRTSLISLSKVEGRMRKKTADGTGIGSLSAVCRISMQMRVHEVHNAVLMLANSLEHRSIIGGE